MAVDNPGNDTQKSPGQDAGAQPDGVGQKMVGPARHTNSHLRVAKCESHSGETGKCEPAEMHTAPTC
jgi:hypothetical protein